jgi:hypothetical protein
MGQAVRLAEDVVEILQELVEERAASRSRAHSRHARARQPLPAESAALVCEGDLAIAEIPYDQPEHGEPPGAEDDIVPHQGNDVEISGERYATDDQRSVADDTDARDAFAVGDQGREARLVLKRQTGPKSSSLRDEVVGAIGVQQGDE